MNAAILVLALAGQDLTEETYARWRDYVAPKPQELLWLQIPWRPRWHGARTEAAEKDKPILMWTMNGHPLGDC